MNNAGLALLILSWSGVILLNAFCFWRMFKIERENKENNE